MVTKIRLVGIALTVAAGLGGFGVLSGGDAAPAMAAPGAAAQATVAAVPGPVPAATVQGATVQPTVDCAKQAWPYVARECLSAVDGTPARKVTRVVTTTAR